MTGAVLEMFPYVTTGHKSQVRMEIMKTIDESSDRSFLTSEIIHSASQMRKMLN